MEITKTDFGKLVDGTKNFCIPVYQRRYSWTKNNCQKIFYDIEKIAKKRNESIAKKEMNQWNRMFSLPHILLAQSSPLVTRQIQNALNIQS